MKRVNQQNSYTLRYENIDRISDELVAFLKEGNMERENYTRIRLSMEESLLRFRDHFGEDKEVTVRFSRSIFRSFIRIAVEGEPFNPLGKEEEELAALAGSLLTAVGLSPQYSYGGKTNEIRLQLPTSGLNPIIRLALALAIGAGIGIIGNLLISSDMKQLLSTTVFQPSLDVWSKLLNALSGPVIFFMVISTMLNTNAITEQGGSSRRVIQRYFAFSAIAAILAVIAANFVFGLRIVRPELSQDETIGVLEQIFRIVPTNFLEPFTTSNTPQILIIAYILSNALMFLGDRTKILDDAAKQANMIGLLLAEWVSRLVFIVSAILLAQEIIEGRTYLLAGLGQPILLAVIVACFFMFTMLLHTCRRMKVSMITVIQKIKGPFLLSLKKGSLDASYGTAERVCIYGLGINRKYTKVSLPQGLILYMPISSIGTLVFTLYAARAFGNVETTLLWNVMAIFLTVFLFVATPPVPGANLLAYIAIFAYLGIPQTALIDAMIFDIIFGLLANAGNQAMLQLEMTLQADRIGLVDRNALRHPPEKAA